ncbi:UbiA family prenyltransferase [Caldimonas brevitalea]|uniref:Membrane protein n=1 Tax=Caldimonas brevitalea TaxID=413882 RepID=A0A0G3BKN4_9BURK|nr:UbiA family prenyltransferase [Caldimonas brevitalea]AKJ27921.1 membrane protein [Caldimonas brevitalea]
MQNHNVLLKAEHFGTDTPSAMPADTLAPLYVDLDGTLIRSDLLLESAMRFVAAQPLQAWRLAAWLMRGKAHLKAELAAAVNLDVRCLPYNEELLGYLRQQRALGRRIVLATASHQKYAQQIAEHLGLFDAVIASDGSVNRKGVHKLEAIRTDAGGRFAYAGNDQVDLDVWREADAALVVNASAGVRRQANAVTREELHVPPQKPGVKVWAKAIRLHQWAKNALLLLPALPIAGDLLPSHWISLLIGFVAFGLCASSVYLLNDLMDLEADRAHPRKRKRPLASGAVSLPAGVVLSVGMLAAAFLLAAVAMPLGFVATLGVYWISTLAYSLYFKRRVLQDVLMLAGLYTLRIIAGAAAIQVMPSFWIMSFSMFLFLSLACIKRYVELRDAELSEKVKVVGRGYGVSDLPFVQSVGTSAGLVAVLVFAMYVNDPTTASHFTRPAALWTICPLVLLWVSRVWLKASRMELHDDPVVFAVTDRASQLIAVLSVVALAVASGVLF